MPIVSGQVPAILEFKRRQRTRNGKPRKVRLRRPPRQRIPKTPERQFRTQILKQVDQVRTLINDFLIPRLTELEGEADIRRDGYREDNWIDKLKGIFSFIRERLTGQSAEAEALGQQFADNVSRENSKRIATQIKSVLGVDVFLGDASIADDLAASATESANLIKDVTREFTEQVENSVLRGFRSGQRASEIAKEIPGIGKKARKRAAFIARDQTNKLNGDLTRKRQTDLGIPGYIWRTSLDERVRGSDKGSKFGPKSGAHDHARLEGTRQTWDKPPVVDQRTGRRAHPGGDFNCRCTAEPDVEGLLRESETD